MKKPKRRAFLIPIGFLLIFGGIAIYFIVQMFVSMGTVEPMTVDDTLTVTVNAGDQAMVMVVDDETLQDLDLEGDNQLVYEDTTLTITSTGDFEIIVMSNQSTLDPEDIEGSPAFATVMFTNDGDYTFTKTGDAEFAVTVMRTQEMLINMMGMFVSGLVGFLGILISMIIILVRRNQYNKQLRGANAPYHRTTLNEPQRQYSYQESINNNSQEWSIWKLNHMERFS